MTYQEIIQELKPIRPCTREQVRYIMRALEIQPIEPGKGGILSQFPKDAPLRIALHLGKLEGNDPLPTMRQLRAVREKARAQ